MRKSEMLARKTTMSQTHRNYRQQHSIYIYIYVLFFVHSPVSNKKHAKCSACSLITIYRICVSASQSIYIKQVLLNPLELVELQLYLFYLVRELSFLFSLEILSSFFVLLIVNLFSVVHCLSVSSIFPFHSIVASLLRCFTLNANSIFEFYEFYLFCEWFSICLLI